MKYKIPMMILFCLIGLGFADRQSKAETPQTFVRTMLDEVIAIQNHPQLQDPASREERRAVIRKVIARDFDFEAMARQALGPYWEKLNRGERAEFQSLFQDLFQESYTKLVLDFLKREKILFGKDDLHQDQALIRTTIIRGNEEIPVDYSLTLVQGKWLVDDVTIDGVSIIRNYQQSFNRIIQRESYKSLLQKMRLQQRAIEKPS
jgi:phospholipid transport system substrate-binding protein